MHQALIDDILIAIGKIFEKRQHRKESDPSVEVNLIDHSGNANLRKKYWIRWHTGNTIELWSEIKSKKVRLAAYEVTWLYDGHLNHELAEDICRIIVRHNTVGVLFDCVSKKEDYYL